MHSACTITAPVKLLGGSHDGEGNLMMYNEEQQLWIPVCYDNFRETAGRIVCQQIGFDDVYEGIRTHWYKLRKFTASAVCFSDLFLLEPIT